MKNHRESLKNSKYQQIVPQVEQSRFCPLIFGGTSGVATAATRTMQRIDGKFSEKRHGSYAETINFIRTKLSFALLRSAILCTRLCRSLRKTQYIDNPTSAAVEEGRLK